MKWFIVILLAVLLVPTVGATRDCIDYGDYLHWVGGVNTPGTAWGVAVEGSYAYVADGDEGLQIIDISMPGSLAIVGFVVTPGSACEVVVKGNFAYMVFEDLGSLQVIDISMLESPELVGAVELPYPATDVAVAGDYAYVANAHFGLQVIDISLPESPVIVGAVWIPGTARSVAVSGEFAYVTNPNYGSGIQVVDISAPESPAVVGAVDLPGTAWDVACRDLGGLQVVDISVPVFPVGMGSVDTPGSALGIAVAGDKAFVGDGFSGLQVIDIANPENPQILGSTDIVWTHALAISGNYAYCIGNSDLNVIDITNYESPQVTGGVALWGQAVEVAISGTFACVANGSDGPYVIDITNPESPQIVATVLVPGAHAVAISGIPTDPWSPTRAMAGVLGRIHVGSQELHMVDITNPESPQILGYLEFSFLSLGEIAISDRYAYVTVFDSYADWSGLYVIEITNPESPQVMGQVITPGSPRDVAVWGNYAYVADGESGLQVIDITNPEEPGICGWAQLPGYAVDVAISGTHAYLSGTSGLQVIDIGNPRSPHIVGTAEILSLNATKLAISNSHAYVACGDFGFQVIDITNPQNPQFVGGVNPTNDAQDVAISGSHVYVADGDFGLQILPVQCGATSAVEIETPILGTHLFEAYPNPFNPQTTIAFDFPRRESVTLRVFDLSGRLVKELITTEPHTPGRHEVVWNGRDEAGRQVASGTYFYRLEAGSYSETKRMVLIK